VTRVIAVVVGVAGILAVGCAPPPPSSGPWMEPQCFRIVAGYPDISYDGPTPNVRGNATEWSTTDDTCAGTASPFDATVVRAPTQPQADLLCSDLYGLPAGGAFGISIANAQEGRPADAWFCAFGG
jgi:hypothetical protein